ncbi:hypothetical protein Tco_0826903, partial [Tanacetum coccineum]
MGNDSLRCRSLDEWEEGQLKDTLVVSIPKFVGEGYTMSIIRVVYEWTPLRCSRCKVFGHVLDDCAKKIISGVLKNLKNIRQVVKGVHIGASSSGKKKQAGLTSLEVTNSDPFDALNTVKNDNELGTNEGNSKLDKKGANSNMVSSAHETLAEAFVNADNDSEVDKVFNEIAGFIASTSYRESEDLIKNPINWDKPPKKGDGAWHANIRLIDPDREEFTKTLQSVPTSRKLSEKEDPMEIIDLDHFYDMFHAVWDQQILTSEAVRSGTLAKAGEKKKERDEESKSKSVRKEEKKAKGGRG